MFGQAPRDVYDGIFHLHETKVWHARRVGRLNYSILSTLVGTFSDSRQLDEFPRHVLVVYPKPLFASLRLDHWVINFKSNQIASQVMELMRSEEDAHLRHLYNLLRQIPESSILAGRIFEARVHHTFSDGWGLDRPMPHRICTAVTPSLLHKSLIVVLRYP